MKEIDTINKLRSEGFTVKEIAKQLNISESAVTYYTSKENKSFTNYTDYEISEVKRMYESGVDVKVIAKRFGRSSRSIYVLVSKLNITRKSPLLKTDTKDLGKGYAVGAVQEVKVRNDRDKGRLVKLKYSDISDKPTVVCEIRVRDESISDEQAVINWGKKMRKRSVCLA